MSEEEGCDHFSTLPYEILSQIFQICKQQEEEEGKIDVGKVSHLRLVCKKFHEVAWDPFYLTKLKIDYDDSEPFRLEQILLQRPYLDTLTLEINTENLAYILGKASTHCPNLKDLEISCYHFRYYKRNPMAAIENMPLLTRLSMLFCKFVNEYEIFESIANSNVEDFTYKSVQTNATKKIGMCKVLQGLKNKLTSLSIVCEILDNNILSLVSQCEHLETLELPPILWNEIVDLSALSKLENLRTLRLKECGYNFAGSKVSRCLRGIVRLETLEIRHNFTFSESDLKTVVESCPDLKFLTLCKCYKLESEDIVLKCTAPLKKLEKVDYNLF